MRNITIVLYTVIQKEKYYIVFCNDILFICNWLFKFACYNFRYTINDPNWLKVDSPVYMSSRGKIFTNWLCNWTALLASKV